ncbi:peptidoglycan-associated lipoprotein Pal [Alcaligenes faecalis]|uniref:Peptidoglycan-associated lipoprotein n=1 Tax=Alcaligenes parafaecalis TaxID=171260 RepID=A0ABT3VND8_9BURK|nr:MULTISPECIES: peptidoglycan-associated lipoprotein Pal [Alcaligenes]MBX6964710.1 peptidoglycan-associated lipoprotein Pal [Providencia rettgeri]MBX7033028.1 peptidoglycan-associated lipoprotein Pal [Alcaligenes faecalis]MCX5464611.1 peptidoglycan-associated lipoprotein Pal [Alcaligenes parafaecalis]QFY78901.1 peptidoglycan-associated lipoprotein Pal [Alcaligenes faecalis]QTC01599.1 peptidoglycan-associated lipoprotein Pal [Alcaligenes sp. SORT26]
MSSRILKSLTLAVMAAALAACSSVPLDQNSGSTGGTGSDSASAGQIMDPFNPQSPLAQQRSVFFDYDSYVVNDQYRGLVEMHASYLSSHPQQTVRIEGNTDERGGAEYNLALGQRRSDAVARMLGLLGVSNSQIEAVSFGKERPKALGNTEADYAENRRADIVYQR